MWNLLKHTGDGYNGDLGVRKAKNIRQLLSMLRKEWGIADLAYEKDQYTDLTYYITSVSHPNISIMAVKYN